MTLGDLLKENGFRCLTEQERSSLRREIEEIKAFAREFISKQRKKKCVVIADESKLIDSQSPNFPPQQRKAPSTCRIAYTRELCD